MLWKYAILLDGGFLGLQAWGKALSEVLYAGSRNNSSNNSFFMALVDVSKV
jgi:hypothetical protein